MTESQGLLLGFIDFFIYLFHFFFWNIHCYHYVWFDLYIYIFYNILSSHSADGISIRFPRVTKVRDDKDWESATTLAELKSLYETSKIISDIAPAPSFTASKDKLKEEEEEDESDEENIKDEGEVHAVSTHTVLTPAEKKDEHIDVVNRNEYLKEETYAPRTMSCLKTEGKRRSPGREEQKRSKLPKLDSEKKSSRPRKQASGYDLDGFVVQDGDDTDDDEDDDGGHLLKEDSDDANDSSSDRVSKGRGSPSCTASRKKCRWECRICFYVTIESNRSTCFFNLKNINFVSFLDK